MQLRLAHTIATAALSLAFALSAAPGVFAGAAKNEKTATTPKGACQAVDMLEEFKSERPAVYARIMAEAEATENGNALLWKVERDGVPTSYLFGTVHLTDERVVKLSPAVQDAIKNSRMIALEVSDLTEQATAAVLAKSAPLVLYTDGRRLDKQLTPAEHETVEKIITRTGLPADMAALFKPWIVTMILSVSDCEREKVQQGERVLDMKIAEIGKARGLEVVGLETIPQQLEALAAVPEAQQLDMLRASLKFADRSNDLMETLIRLYLDRKVSAALPFQIALAREAGIGDEAFAGFQQKLLFERNAKMHMTAEPLLEKGALFIAVGALHLPGPQGLVALLRQSGYTVTPVE